MSSCMCFVCFTHLSLVSLNTVPAPQSATALGATFDTELIEKIGRDLLGPEAKAKATSILLAPTCNIQRVCRVPTFFFLTLAESKM